MGKDVLGVTPYTELGDPHSECLRKPCALPALPKPLLTFHPVGLTLALPMPAPSVLFKGTQGTVLKFQSLPKVAAIRLISKLREVKIVCIIMCKTCCICPGVIILSILINYHITAHSLGTAL